MAVIPLPVQDLDLNGADGITVYDNSTTPAVQSGTLTNDNQLSFVNDGRTFLHMYNPLTNNRTVEIRTAGTFEGFAIEDIAGTTGNAARRRITLEDREDYILGPFPVDIFGEVVVFASEIEEMDISVVRWPI